MVGRLFTILASFLLLSAMPSGVDFAHGQQVSGGGRAPLSRFDTDFIRVFYTDGTPATDDEIAELINRIRAAISTERDPAERGRMHRTMSYIWTELASVPGAAAERERELNTAEQIFQQQNLRLDMAQLLLLRDDLQDSRSPALGRVLQLVSPTYGWHYYLQARCAQLPRPSAGSVQTAMRDHLACGQPVPANVDTIEVLKRWRSGQAPRTVLAAATQNRAKEIAILQTIDSSTLVQDERRALKIMAQKVLALDRSSPLFASSSVALLTLDDAVLGKARALKMLTQHQGSVMNLSGLLDGFNTTARVHHSGDSATAAADEAARLRAGMFDKFVAVTAGARWEEEPIDEIGGVAVLAPILLTESSGLVIALRAGKAGVSASTGLAQKIMEAERRNDLYKGYRVAAGDLAGLVAGQRATSFEGWKADYDRAYSESWRDQTDIRPPINAAIARFVEVHSRQLGAQIAAALTMSGVKPGDRVVLIADGPLSTVPIGLLHNPATSRPFIDDYEISISPNLRALSQALARVAGPGDRSLMVVSQQGPEAPPTASIEVAGLAGLAGELGVPHRIDTSSAVAALISSQGPRLGAAARDLFDGGSVWHFSTHAGFRPENPFESGLKVTSDQELSVTRLQEAAAWARPPRLVFLAACETALVDVRQAGDEFIGLPGVFLGNNAAAVVGSLWTVSDLATTLLSLKFYDEFLRKNSRPSAALRAAQLWIRDATLLQLRTFADEIAPRLSLSDQQKLNAEIASLRGLRPFSEPFYWGGWVVYGQ